MILAFGAFELDPKRRTLTCGGNRVALLSRPFDILVFLIGARERVVSRAEMQVAIWPGQLVTANNLTVQISQLRRVLAQHGAGELIITVPGRGYRFVGDIAECAPLPAEPLAVEVSQPEADPAPERAGFWYRSKPLVGPRAAAIAIASLAAAAVAAAALLPRPYGGRFPVHVQVETVPDTVGMVSDGYCKVDYVFRVLERSDLQLDSEDVRFSFTTGEPIGLPSLGGRIYHGSLPIGGRGNGVYHNNIWLPPAVAAAVRASNRDELYLRHDFHLRYPNGVEVTVPAILKIVIVSADDSCAVPKGR
jgi:DNA-binding winged helix-turn-helix (wHTH) protein